MAERLALGDGIELVDDQFGDAAFGDGEDIDAIGLNGADHVGRMDIRAPEHDDGADGDQEHDDRQHLDAEFTPALRQRSGNGRKSFHGLQFGFVFGVHDVDS